MNESKATRYQRYRRRAQAAGVACGALMLAVVALTPLARSMAALAEGYGRGLPATPHAGLSLVLFVLGLVVVWEAAMLPAMLYLALKVDRRYALRAPAVEDVLAAQAHATLFALPAALAAGALVRLSIWIAGGGWWVLAGVLLAAALVAALHGAPAALARLTGARPLAREGLVDRLACLATRAGVPVAGIDEMASDDGAAAALVTGAGRSRRVFVSSELARDWTDDEIAVVIAHELGHHAHHDLWRTLAFDAVVLSVGLWAADWLLAGPGSAMGLPAAPELAALPFIALIGCAVWIVATPLRHALSRSQERRADRFALTLTGSSDAFSAAVRRLGARHLAEERPSALTQWLYHRHPPVAERLALAQTFVRPPASGRRSPD